MTEHLPRILAEDSPPAHLRSCGRCELAGHKSRLIWGEGNRVAPLFVVLDNPGAREDREGTPYLCGTRETLQKAAYEAGFEPASIYISYILKCRPRKTYDKESARAICINFLWGQLATAQPHLVMCLGNVVCRSLFGDPEAEVKELRGQIRSVKGHKVIASYHPLAVRRRPVLYKYFLEDWRLAAEQLQNVTDRDRSRPGFSKTID